jgi:DNA-binding CsgD family transcriptional regulator/PAS domain-containing protein
MQMKPVLSLEVLSSLIEDVYESALDVNHWIGFLVRLNEVLDAAYVGILVTNTQENTPRMAFNSPWDQMWINRLFNEFLPIGLPGVENFTYDDLDTPRSTLSQMTETEFQKSDFYTQWAGPQGLRDGGVIKFLEADQRFGFMSVVTRNSRDIIGEREFNILRLLSPHVRRAALIGDLLDHQRIENILLRGSLNSLEAPIILVNREGVVHYCNDPAQSYLSSSKGLRIIDHKLRATNPIARLALDSALSSININALGNQGLGIPISAVDEPPAVAYTLPLTRAQKNMRYSSDLPGVAVFIATAKANQPIKIDVLCTLYNLTQAEARVMLKVAEGGSTKEVSNEMGNSTNTVNTHLARVFEKTGLNRRSDIVKLVNDLSSPLRELV